MALQIQHDFILPNPKRIKVGNQTLQVYDAMDLRPVLTQLKAALDSLSGRGSGPAQITGQLAMNSNKITGVVNSVAPTSDEAVSYGLAQQQYTVFRPSVSTQRGNYNIKPTDGTIRADASFGANVQILPPSATVLGKCFTVKKIDATTNKVNVVCVGTDQVDGATTYALTAKNKYVTVQARQGGFDVVANN